MLPTVIGIGAAKAGTTWLFNCLQEHPDVYMAPVKETKFFDEERIEGRRAEYEAHFSGARAAKAVGEISVRYLASKRGAAERIHAWMPDARLFVSLRNPLDQIWSHYWHLRRQNFHQFRASGMPATAEEAVRRYPELLMEPALYGKHLAHWLQIFGREKLHVILYDDIVARPEAVIERLYTFIGVDAAFRPTMLFRRDSADRRGTSPRAPWLGVAHEILYEILNHRCYRILKQVAGAWRAERIKNRLRFRQALEGIFMRSGYPPMPPATRELLARVFADDLDQLETLTGRSMTAWRESADAGALAAVSRR